jgi:16S rRNA G1207 methylase RsmC
MKQSIFQKRRLAITLLVILLVGLWADGYTLSGEKQGEPVKEEEKAASKYQAKYYHFNDVLVPGELNYHQKKSFIYETPQFKTGTLVFSKWRLDVGSLIDFFSYHMEKDNWKLVNSFKGKEAILNFSKPDKNCTIKVYERWDGMVEVEIRVGPLGEKKM